VADHAVPEQRGEVPARGRSRTQIDLRRNHHHSDFSAADLLALKGCHRISLCIPARNEAATVGRIVATLQAALVRDCPLLDELVVLDHASTDETATVSRDAGATVISADLVLPEYGPAIGKGDVLWRSLTTTSGDIVVWLDADLVGLTADVVVGLVGPLLVDPSVTMVRAVYERALAGEVGEGGRVTELTARPVLSLLHPRLAHVRQPLGGEYAARREVLEAVPFEPDYGVEMGLLIDVAAGWGAESIAQVDVGQRVHRNRPLSSLTGQAREVLRAALSRADTSASAGLRGDLPLRPPMRDVRVRDLVG
jgi:glucosyl-3-phosphoglycerate synthase